MPRVKKSGRLADSFLSYASGHTNRQTDRPKCIIILTDLNLFSVSKGNNRSSSSFVTLYFIGEQKQCQLGKNNVKCTFRFAATRKLAEAGILCDFFLRRIVRRSRNYFLIFLLHGKVLGMVEDKQVRRAEQHPGKHSANKLKVSSRVLHHVAINFDVLLLFYNGEVISQEIYCAKFNVCLILKIKSC